MRAIDADYVLTALAIFTDTEHGNPHFMNGIECAKEIVENASSIGQWISVKDDLPITITLDRWEDSDFVLVHSEADEYGFGYYTIFNNGTGHWTADNTIKHKIDYWLRIPEIPNGK